MGVQLSVFLQVISPALKCPLHLILRRQAAGRCEGPFPVDVFPFIYFVSRNCNSQQQAEEVLCALPCLAFMSFEKVSDSGAIALATQRGQRR